MISIIISSRDPQMLAALSKNIDDTVGTPYEIISIENSKGQMGICAAYNIGASKARYEILCFMHEDILFETKDWGKKLEYHLRDTSVGLVGNMGGDRKLKVPASFAVSLYELEAHVILHPSADKSVSDYIDITFSPQNPSNIKEVTCIDGMWMCTRKDVYAKFKFDEKTLRGFHGYDIDYSLQVSAEYKVCVVSDIWMHHFSAGNCDRAYMESKIALNRKWNKLMPRSVKPFTAVDYTNLHWQAMEIFIGKLFELRYSMPFILKQYLFFSANEHFRSREFIKVLAKIILRKFPPAGQKGRLALAS